MKQAMIFAAGMGTRLKPLTDRMPKALVEVGGKPLLQHVAERLIGAGFQRMVVNVHHFADMICDYLQENNNFGISITTSDEREKLLETGGAIKKAAPLFEPGGILIHNVDILSNVNLEAFYEEASGCDALLLVSERKTARYLLFNDDMRLVGWTNIQTGEVRSPYEDININACHKYAFAGIHVISTKLIDAMSSWPERFGIIEFYLDSCINFNIKGKVKYDLQLLDVGKLDTLEEANNFIKNI